MAVIVSAEGTLPRLNTCCQRKADVEVNRKIDETPGRENTKEGRSYISVFLRIWQLIWAAVKPGGEEGGMPTELQNPCKLKHDSVIDNFALFSGLTKGK